MLFVTSAILEKLADNSLVHTACDLLLSVTSSIAEDTACNSSLIFCINSVMLTVADFV